MAERDRTGGVGVKRYPFAPLAALMGLGEFQAARRLRVSGSTAQQYRRDGLSELVADRLAVRAGFHPAEVWPDHGEDERRAVIAGRRRRSRARARKAVRVRERERNRRYYRESRDYLLAAQRRYKTANADRVRAADRAYKDANRDRINARQRAYYRANRERMLAAQRERDRARMVERVAS